MGIGFFGQHTEKTKNRIREKVKIIRAERKRRLGYINSPESRINMSIAHLGKPSPKRGKIYNGGISPIITKIRTNIKYKEWKQRIFIRDNFTCQECNQIGGKLEVHHCKKTIKKIIEEIKFNLPLLPLYEASIIYSPLWDLDNGITLCEKCHQNIHRGGLKWQKLR